ncbi:RNA polymerase sigma factor [Pedobacter aquatilis]|uniref:RNA polymerase sigma factor n=1 Tax=Pedobacter aquatilis TaxID=351343 RepID=UPI002931E0DA|nr:sigma-70 family RNA polymerase sigma factor [Pedobacter aquatilis]
MIKALHNKPFTGEGNSASHMLEMPEDKLVKALKAQDQVAFNYLYRYYSAALHGILLRMVNQQETAEDLLQEVFLKINKGILGYDTQRGRLFTWMLNLAKNTAIDHIRLTTSKCRLRSEEIENCVNIIDAAGCAQTNTDSIGLRTIIGGLTLQEQKLLNLVYYGGYTHIEAAAALAMPLGTVKTRIRAAILKLRKYYN